MTRVQMAVVDRERCQREMEGYNLKKEEVSVAINPFDTDMFLRDPNFTSLSEHVSYTFWFCRFDNRRTQSSRQSRKLS